MSDIDDQIRRDFAVTKKTIYMNNGAIAPTPLSTIKAVTDFMLKCAEAGPDARQTSEYITSLLDELRTRLAHLINCDRDEVVLVQSTTEGLNMAANGIGWKQGDAIVVRGGRHEHHANYLPWVSLWQRKGVQLRELAIDESGYFDLGDLEKLIKGARLVTMSHALYNTGAIMPLEEVGRIAQQNNALFCVDAAQSAGTIPIDVKKMGCHFMAFPGFKWLCGPTGIGAFYCSKKASEMLSPQTIGGESATLSEQNVISFFDMPARFQAGFRNYPGAAGLEASLRYILRIGLEGVRKKNMKAAGILRDEIGKIPNVKMYGPDDENKRTSIVTFTTLMDSSILVQKLEQGSIIVAARDIGGGKKAVRAAPHFFNSEEEAETAASYVKNLLR
ncbi:MAG TPA: aminotransferase class V-fold PLP-dependent enzyme [Nitrososphaera sp.]|jgi:cysteine desulfurase/selenocysteine lyase|nr:aminotransferase class V-fold PLP-dependent enzyme [Nitrososphaera sp.]